MNENEKNDACNDNAEEHFFTCKDCGGHDLIVRIHGKLFKTVTETQDCVCDNGNDIAYELKYDEYTPFEKVYWLDEDHSFTEKLEEEYDTPEKDEEIENNIYCEDCYKPTDQCDINDGDPNLWEVEYEEYFVECNGCNREIEFGWSHIERREQIFPAECKDFDPWECYPDSRYHEEWRKKNWLDPDKQY